MNEQREVRRGRTAPVVRKPSRRDRLFAAAAQHFNRAGISATSINDIARGLGLTRAALYYYVDDREDLVFQCYLRACELTAEDLGRASEEGRDGLARVLAFLRRALAPDRPPTTVLSEIDYLPDALRAVVHKAQRRNVATLQDLITEGMADGSIRPCGSEIVAQTLFGICNWVVLSPDWTGRSGAGEATLRATIEVLTDLLTGGLASDPQARFSCPVDVASFAEPVNLFDRQSTAAQKSNQLIEIASKLFNRCGVEGASIDDIVATVGATKGTFYHYFADKAELVVRSYDRAFDLAERFADTAEAEGANGLAKSLIGLHLNAQAHIAGPYPLAPGIGIEALPPTPRRHLISRVVRIRDRYAGFGRQGIEDGSIRPCDVAALSLAGAGAFGWIQKWLEDGEARKWEIADEIAGLFLHGLKG